VNGFVGFACLTVPLYLAWIGISCHRIATALEKKNGDLLNGARELVESVWGGSECDGKEENCIECRAKNWLERNKDNQ